MTSNRIQKTTLKAVPKKLRREAGVETLEVAMRARFYGNELVATMRVRFLSFYLFILQIGQIVFI